MRASWALASLFSAVMMFNAVPGDGAAVFVRSCDDLLPGEMEVEGTITFLRDISCQEPRVVHIIDDFVLRSHAVLDTKNIHFKVHNGATMTLRSPGVTIVRDHGSTLPLFSIAGKVIFETTGSIPEIMDGSLEDEGGVIYRTFSGIVETAQEIRYGADSVAVSRMPKPGEEPGISGQQAVELSPALKASQAAYHAKLQAHADGSSHPSSSSPSSTSSSASTPSSSSSSTTPSSPTSSENDVEGNCFLPTSYFDAPGGPGIHQSAHVNHAPVDTAATNGKNEKARHTTANSDHHGTADDKSPSASPIASPTVLPTPASDPVSPANTFGGGPTTPASGIPTASANPTSPSSPDNPSPTPGSSHDHGHRPSPHYGDSHSPTPGSSSSPGGQHKNSDDDRSGSQRKGPGIVSGPKLALKVGEVREPPFRSGSGKSMMWPAEDGSLMFYKTFAPSVDAFTGAEGTRRGETTVMVPPDDGRLNRLIKARLALRKEMAEGSVSESKTGTRGAWGWVPWGQQHLQDVEMAREHSGEISMTFDARACVEVTVDGICVLSKSGPYRREWMNRFPWRRRKDNEYELFVTEEGMEVHLGEKTIWGVAATDVMD